MVRQVNVAPWLTVDGLGENDFAPCSPTMSMVVAVLAGVAVGMGAVGLPLELPEPPQLQIAIPTTTDPTMSDERIRVSFHGRAGNRLPSQQGSCHGRDLSSPARRAGRCGAFLPRT